MGSHTVEQTLVYQGKLLFDKLVSLWGIGGAGRGFEMRGLLLRNKIHIF